MACKREVLPLMFSCLLVLDVEASREEAGLIDDCMGLLSSVPFSLATLFLLGVEVFLWHPRCNLYATKNPFFEAISAFLPTKLQCGAEERFTFVGSAGVFAALHR